jgi:hypothetical protein
MFGKLIKKFKYKARDNILELLILGYVIASVVVLVVIIITTLDK